MDSSETPDDEPPRTLENQPPTSPKPKGLEWANQQHPSSSEEMKQTLEDILPSPEITMSTAEIRKKDQLPSTSEYRSPTSSEAKTLQSAEKLQSYSSASFAVRKREAISDEGLTTSRKTQKMDPDAIQRQPGLFGEKQASFENVMNSFEDWVSFERFGLSRYGLNLGQSDIDRIGKENNSVEERIRQTLLKWMENNRDATASDLHHRVTSYIVHRPNLYRRVLDDVEKFREFTLSENGLRLRAFDIQDIIEDDRSSDDTKIHLIRNKWENKHGKKLTTSMLNDFLGRYLDAAFLPEVNDFLRDVEEFRKFALSRHGLHLNASDIRDILEDDRISKQQKIEEIESKWKERMGKQQADSMVDDCKLRYANKDCIGGRLTRRVWIPNFGEKYSQEENQLLQGKLIDVVPLKPVDIWSFRRKDEDKAQVDKLRKLKRHTNVGTFIGYSYHEDYIFIIMERSWRDTLSDALQTQLDDKLSIGLCLQLLKGLAFLHENDIVHSDLSPKAILVSKDRNNLKITGYYIGKSNDKLLADGYQSPEYLSNRTISTKMNVYTAGLLLNEILSNGRHSLDNILSEDDQNVERKKLDFTHVRPSNRPVVEELIIPMTNLDPKSRPTVLEVLRDFTFLAYKILSESSTDTSTISNSIIQCKRTVKNIEETIQWVRNESGTWTQTVQASSSSILSQPSTEPGVESISVYDQKVTNEDMIKIARQIRRSFKKWDVEFCDCAMTVDHLKLFYDNLFVDNEISKFKIGYTRKIVELMKMICFIVNKCKIPNLSFECDYLDNDAVDLLKKCFHDQQIYCVEELDIRYNKLIGPVGFERVGELMREFCVGTLRATDCDITDEKLEKFLRGIQDHKLNVLDISCNTQLTRRGFEILAEAVSRKGIGTLIKLSDCDLTDETIAGFHEHLAQKTEKQLVEHLDVSYNPSMTPNDCLGSIILKCGISKLNLAGCKLTENHVVHLRESMSKHQMDEISMRDNRTITTSLMEIARLAKQSKLKELDISDCMFSAPELGRFREKLEGAKLQCLHLGDEKRECDIPYMEEICNLLPNVNDIMYLQFQKLINAARHLLQDCFMRESTKRINIKLSGGITEEWTKHPGTLM